MLPFAVMPLVIAAPSILLRFHPPVGKTVSYAVTIKKSGSPPAKPTESRTTTALRFLSPTSVEIAKSVWKVTPSNTVTPMGTPAVFSGKPVTVGSTWEAKLDGKSLAPGLSGQVSVTYRLARVEGKGGRTFARVTASLTKPVMTVSQGQLVDAFSVFDNFLIDTATGVFETTSRTVKTAHRVKGKMVQERVITLVKRK